MTFNISYRNLGIVKSEILFFTFLLCTTLALSQPANVTEEDVIKKVNAYQITGFKQVLDIYNNLTRQLTAHKEVNINITLKR